MKDLKVLSSPVRAGAVAKYFKTGKGQYGYGDIFWGIPVPAQRAMALKYKLLPLNEVEKLLQKKVHECRLTALFILVRQYSKGDDKTRSKIVKIYLKNLKYVNNWDLVDSSAPQILGSFLLTRSRKILYGMARSKNLWQRRIAIMSTFSFIRMSDFSDTLKLAELLMKDEHDLIHKATGWALREVGNVSPGTERIFLSKYAGSMPRTMLRYAIEKFPDPERRKYLSVKQVA